MIIIKIILAILIIFAVVNIFFGLFFGDGEGILIAGILCFFIVGMYIMMPIISNTVDKVQDDSSTICEKVTSESIEKETAETVVNETPEITKTVETETAKVETDKAVEELIDSFKGEDSVEGEKSSETSEETEGVGMGTIIIIMLIIFSPALLFIGLDLIEDIINGTCFLKKKKETPTEEFVREMEEHLKYTFGTSRNVPPSKPIPTPKQKKEIDIDKLAEKDSKIAYIVWAVKFLNDQGKENYTRKLESYYIPEIIQAYDQYHKVKNFHVKEMTAEAKKHYEKIVDLSYKVANVEVKKAAGEIVMDMDCNADVCEDIYKRDGYCSMQEEIQESHTAEKKKEQALHAKAISKDTYVFWTSEE